MLPLLTPWTRPLSTRIGRLGLLLALLALAACRREAEPVAGAPDEPVAAVEALAEALREGDLQRYAELSLPPAMHAQQKALWRQQVAAKNPVDEEQAKRYAELMAQLTAPDAETALWAKAEPKLAALEQELGPKWTLGVTMLSGFATTAIGASETMSEAEKSHATGVVTALAEWAGDQAQFTDRERAKQALGSPCAPRANSTCRTSPRSKPSTTTPCSRRPASRSGGSSRPLPPMASTPTPRSRK